MSPYIDYIYTYMRGQESDEQINFHGKHIVPIIVPTKYMVLKRKLNTCRHTMHEEIFITIVYHD